MSLATCEVRTMTGQYIACIINHHMTVPHVHINVAVSAAFQMANAGHPATRGRAKHRENLFAEREHPRHVRYAEARLLGERWASWDNESQPSYCSRRPYRSPDGDTLRRGLVGGCRVRRVTSATRRTMSGAQSGIYSQYALVVEDESQGINKDCTKAYRAYVRRNR